PPLRDALRPAPERAAVARSRVPARRAHAASLSPMVNRLTVIGTGLIGASIGLAAKEHGAHVLGWDTDPHALAAAGTRGAIDGTASSLAAALEGADLAVVAAPIAALPGEVATVLETAAEATTVTDVGST